MWVGGVICQKRKKKHNHVSRGRKDVTMGEIGMGPADGNMKPDAARDYRFARDFRRTLPSEKWRKYKK